MRKLLIIGIITLSVFLIYLSTLDRKVYFLTLSSELNPAYNDRVKKDLQDKKILEKYITEFNGNDYRITDFFRMIENNKTISLKGKEQSIKNALIKADIVTLEIGKVDLFSKLAYEQDEETLYNYVDEIADDMKKLLDLIRVYCKEDIYIVEIYNPHQIFPSKIIHYMNDKMKYLSKEYRLHYVDYKISDDMIYNEIELNEKGQAEIYKSLNKSLSKTLFNK